MRSKQSLYSLFLVGVLLLCTSIQAEVHDHTADHSVQCWHCQLDHNQGLPGVPLLRIDAACPEFLLPHYTSSNQAGICLPFNSRAPPVLS